MKKNFIFIILATIANFCFAQENYVLTFNVTDADANAITNAVITVDGQTNAAGNYVFTLAPGTYKYLIEAPTYPIKPGEIEIINQDVTLPVTLSKGIGNFYDITFNVQDAEGAAIDDAVLTFNGKANSPGSYILSFLDAGIYDYSISKTGYITHSGKFMVVKNETVNITLQPTPTYDVVFNISGANAPELPISDAVITFNNQVYEAGKYTFEDLEPGSYRYIIEKSGYAKASGTLQVTDSDLSDYIIILATTTSPKYTVTFDVKDQDNVMLENAIITFNEIAYPEGEYQIADIEAGIYTYSISKSEYIATTGTVMVVGNETIEKSLVYKGPELYDFSFIIMHMESVSMIMDAIVAIDDEQHESGNYQFTNIPAGRHKYIIKPGGEYANISGYMNVPNGLMDGASMGMPGSLLFPSTVQISSSQTFDIRFDIVDEDNVSVEDAIITFNGITNEPGLYTVNVEAGVYNYTIEKEGYILYNGKAVVIESESIAVEMVHNPSYKVTFAITGIDMTAMPPTFPVTDAVIIFDGKEYAAGIYEFDNLAPGKYRYIIKKTGFATEAGTLTITNADQNNYPVILMAGMPTQTYTLTFDVTNESSEPLEGATVSFNKIAYPEGQYEITSVEPGLYEYSINKVGYETVSGTVMVVGKETITETLVYKGVTEYDFSFIIMDIKTSTYITDAVVAIDYEEHASGDYTFTNIPEGRHKYIVKPGGNYANVSGHVNIPTDLIDGSLMGMSGWLLPHTVQAGTSLTFDITFNITDESFVAIDKATITFDGVKLEPGTYTVNKEAGIYDYSIEKAGYTTFTGRVVIVGDEAISIEMEALPTHTVTFSVMSIVTVPVPSMSPVTDAIITLGDITNAAGDYVFNVVPGTYDYKVTKSGYSTETGKVTVSDKNEKVTVNIFVACLVTFNITDSETNAPINDAIITFGETTYESGVYEFSVPMGMYVYTITKEGYSPQSTTVAVMADTTFDVALTKDDVQVGSQNLVDVAVAPNPFSEFITIQDPKQEITRIYISDISGKVILSKQLDNDKSISTSSLINGVYFITVENVNGGKQIFKLLKK